LGFSPGDEKTDVCAAFLIDVGSLSFGEIHSPPPSPFGRSGSALRSSRAQEMCPWLAERAMAFAELALRHQNKQSRTSPMMHEGVDRTQIAYQKEEGLAAWLG
jgi:hypothetical protein